METKECAELCIKYKVDCPNNTCKMWIDYGEDLNCANISIKKNGNMTLRQIAEREHVSFVRIQQIEKQALKKLKLKINN